MRRTLGIVLAVVAIAVGAWFLFARADPGAPVRARLDAFADMVNKSTVDGLGPEARSAQLGTFYVADTADDMIVLCPACAKQTHS